MNTSVNQPQYDVVIVGSGTCGATLAKELSSKGKSVLLLERGKDKPLKESIMGFVTIADEVKLGKGIATVRGLTLGGSTGLYFGVANNPPLDVFADLGIDLTDHLAQVRSELPIKELPDDLIGAQSKVLRDSAIKLGHAWAKNEMLIDQSQCQGGYNYDAKWKARSYVRDAVAQGSTLITGAMVKRVLVENNQAIGVEYQQDGGWLGTKTIQVYGKKIVLAAGELATPKLLRDSGVDNIADKGFFCDPGYALYGLVDDLAGSEGFVASMGGEIDDGIELGDACVSKPLYKLMMLGSFKLKHLFNYPKCIGIGVKVKDQLGGELTAEGKLQKSFSEEDKQKLAKGEAEARRILEKAGAKHIFNVGLTSAGHVGGMVRIGEHLDANLQTQFENLHVCDGSVLPEQARMTPTVTLVCLGKYLANHIQANV